MPSTSEDNAGAHLKRNATLSEMRITGCKVAVAVTNGRLDSFAELAEICGTWERIFSGQAEWLAEES